MPAEFKNIAEGSRPFIVAVDGPAGSGKSSICAAVCRELGWSYVNTGALYRAVGVIAYDQKIAMEQSPALVAVVKDFCDNARWLHDSARLFYGDKDLTPRLSSVEAAAGASNVAKMPFVRDILKPLQRKLSLSAPRGAIVDGRDIGTVIFPDAGLKIFMTASLEQRALRRMKQLDVSGSGSSLSKQDVMKSIESRDKQDSDRDAAPMRMADDAVLFDTSDLGEQEAIQKLKELLVRKFKI
jgi:cytidylate kinase